MSTISLITRGVVIAAAACLCITVPTTYGGQEQPGILVSLGDLKSQAPPEWIEETPTSQFRIKQFRLPAVGDDKENAQLLIFSFGPRGGGSVDANVKRWKSMFLSPEGKTIDEVAKVEKLKID